MSASHHAVIPGGKAQLEMLLKHHYPELATISDPVWSQVLATARMQSVAANRPLIGTNQVANDLILLLEGSIRVSQHSDDGREITFYRVDAGRLCSLNLYSLFHQKSLGVNVTAETPLIMLAIKRADVMKAFHGSEGFRNIALMNLTESVYQLAMNLVDNTFTTLEKRLIEVLHELARRQQSPTIKITHQGIANELGSTREVISRLLKSFEQRGKLKLSRGYIELTCPRIKEELSLTN